MGIQRQSTHNSAFNTILGRGISKFFFRIPYIITPTLAKRRKA